MTDNIETILHAMGDVAVAVSGGVDSMTLAFMAHRTLGVRATMYHATSPAVPRDAGDRVHRHAKRHGWNLAIISAGEFDDADYLRNPVNRCFFCKTNLYGAIASHSHATILSGTNVDDLGDYRPGLDAARNHGVRHPWVEAGLTKQAVRALARSVGLEDLAELPAAPCLSSRVETGIAVEATALGFIDQMERLISERMAPLTVRCRLRHEGVAIELDEASLADLLSDQGAALRDATANLAARHGYGAEVRFEPYRMGSAFRHP